MGTAHKDFEQSKNTAKTCLDLLLAWITAKTNLLSAKYTTRTRLRRPGRSALGLAGAACRGPPSAHFTADSCLRIDVCACVCFLCAPHRSLADTPLWGLSKVSTAVSQKCVGPRARSAVGPLVPCSQRGHVRGPTEPAFAVRAHADKEAAHAIDKTLAPRVL